MAISVIPGIPDRPHRHLRLVGAPSDSSLPRTRGECRDGARPCPLVSCRHHLAVDVGRKGRLTVHWEPDEEPDRPSCALDVAEQAGGLSPAEVATLIGVTRQGVRVVEEKAVRKMKRRMRGVE